MVEIWYRLRAVVTCYLYICFMFYTFFFISPRFTPQKITLEHIMLYCHFCHKKKAQPKITITHLHPPTLPAQPATRKWTFPQVGSIAWKILRALGPQKVVGVQRALRIPMERLGVENPLGSQDSHGLVDDWYNIYLHKLIPMVKIQLYIHVYRIYIGIIYIYTICFPFYPDPKKCECFVVISYTLPIDGTRLEDLQVSS